MSPPVAWTALALSLLLATPASADTFTVGPADGKVTFTVANLAGHVVGTFEDFSASVQYDPAHPESASIEAMFITSSLQTKNAQRDNHLRSEDFFDATNHPRMTFLSKGSRVVPGGLILTGDLTIRGITREIELAVTGPGDEELGADGKLRRRATASASVQRIDFGMDWRITGALVGPEVAIAIDVAMKKKPAVTPDPAAKDPATTDP